MAKAKKQKLVLELEVQNLNPTQARLLRSINTLLLHTLMTENEAEFFEGSAEIMRISAALIKQANFVKQDNSIPYASQVLEYSVDLLQEQISEDQVVTLDN